MTSVHDLVDELLGAFLSWIIQQAWSIARLRVSSKVRQTLLDAWIMQKGWTVENPALDQIVESSSGPGAKRRG